ncbi:DUF1566 domain-containing protein [Marixanthomonas sp. SCSIO 43207]|uniref:Lcl domain-containing protein n=1 Tax=Marixanthomonas sp. SCSIO 43207 TaxID=2779360 RepID=UPI001CA8BCA3|nr:DUF1566 domain-containing protein [Marixanthomonas sp. SCSIO 43207]UAB80613.1 DUF1566 domain-containing protein [Marixanthomonas sp. SCSIO 43207]
MKQIILILLAISSITCFAQVGINTTEPSTTLQVEGNAMTTTTPDGVQPPSITLQQLDAKVAVYNAEQDGAILYVNDVSVASTTSETEDINLIGYYFYNASDDKWIALGNDNSSSSSYSVGDFAHGGVVFWVDETGKHGLVCAKEDQSSGVRWYAGTFGNTQAKGDGPYAGKANTNIIISSQVAIGDDNVTYAARICNELQITEGGKTYGDWYLPSREELNIMYQNKAIIEATSTANSGSNFNSTNYWSSTEPNANSAFRQNLSSGFQTNSLKNNTNGVRAIRAF